MGLDALPAAFNYHYNDKELLKIFHQEVPWCANGLLFPKYFLELINELHAAKKISLQQKQQLLTNIQQAKQRNTHEIASYIFQELETTPFKRRAKFLGNVHAFSAGQAKQSLPVLQANLLEQNKNILIFDLIRHPITRLDTYINYKTQWYDTQKYGSYVKIGVDNCLQEKAELVKRIENEFNVDFSISRNKVFFWDEYANPENSHLMVNYKDVRDTMDIPRVTFESLRNKKYYTAFVKALLRGKRVNRSYIKKVFNPNNFNQGRVSDKNAQHERHDPKICYQKWSAWEKSRFKERVAENKLDKFYAQFGYDLSFIFS